MYVNMPCAFDIEVALRKESVDRNFYCSGHFRFSWVALRKESVDRNIRRCSMWALQSVALRKESVDRNIFQVGQVS